MDRREFTLQMYSGKPPVPSIVPHMNDVTGREAYVAVAPTWRCSGCLMAWGVYGPTTNDGRPEGRGCEQCTNASWLADTPAARMIDNAVGIDANQALDQLHPAAPYALAAAKHAIQSGRYFRLTTTVQRFISDKVRTGVTQTLEQWISRHRPLMGLRWLNIDFGDSTMTVSVCIGARQHPSNVRDQHFRVRYRWVQ